MTTRGNTYRPVWLVRAGARGEDEAANLEEGLAIIGYQDIPDLTGLSSRDSVLERVRSTYPGRSEQSYANQATQLHSFAVRMQEGDIVVLPFKTRPGQIALGRATGPYLYQEIEGLRVTHGE